MGYGYNLFPFGFKGGIWDIKHFMLNSAEHEIINVRKCKHIKKFSFFRLRQA